jgi:SAM-dependent methyltransferase
MRFALDRVFGEQLLQIGLWGARGTFLRYARTQRRALVDWESDSADILSNPEQLAIASDSVDAVLLPHTLERTESPHALLREVDRVLRADGQLLVLSFATDGLWGLRHYLSPGGYPRGRERAIREGRLRDWLELLRQMLPFEATSQGLRGGARRGGRAPALHLHPPERVGTDPQLGHREGPRGALP